MGYTMPGQQGTEEMRQEMAGDPTCTCGHICWIHSGLIDACNGSDGSGYRCPCRKFVNRRKPTREKAD